MTGTTLWKTSTKFCVVIIKLCLCFVVWICHELLDNIAYPTTQQAFHQQDLTCNGSHLSPALIKKVKNFVFFVGYERSGHSIVGSLMDAHPHVIIANEYFLFEELPGLDNISDSEWKGQLFEKLYKKSVLDAGGTRTSSKKGYTLEVKDLWQGRFDDHIEVIGDKSGGRTTKEYMHDKESVQKYFKKLQDLVSIPVRVIHVVRNPFDIISTRVIYKVFGTNYKQIRSALSSTMQKFLASNQFVSERICHFFREVRATVEMIEEVIGRENVLEVHNCDLVSNPRGTLSRIFQFIEVDTSEQFLDACATKVFESQSRSRDTIEWSPPLRSVVEIEMKKYKHFNRYSFSSD